MDGQREVHRKGYPGASLLSTLNIHSRQSTTVPRTWGEKEKVIAVIAKVTTAHGYGELTLDINDGPTTDEDRIRSYGATTPQDAILLTGTVNGPAGQWMSFRLTDLMRDRDGRFTEQACESREYGSLPESITFIYGANALLPESDRAAFAEQLTPFMGLTRPEPLTS